MLYAPAPCNQGRRTQPGLDARLSPPRAGIRAKPAHSAAIVGAGHESTAMIRRPKYSMTGTDTALPAAL